MPKIELDPNDVAEVKTAIERIRKIETGILDVSRDLRSLAEELCRELRYLDDCRWFPDPEPADLPGRANPRRPQ